MPRSFNTTVESQEIHLQTPSPIVNYFCYKKKAKVSKVLEFPVDSLVVVTAIKFSTRYISIFDGSLSIMRKF